MAPGAAGGGKQLLDARDASLVAGGHFPGVLHNVGFFSGHELDLLCLRDSAHGNEAESDRCRAHGHVILHGQEYGWGFTFYPQAVEGAGPDTPDTRSAGGRCRSIPPGEVLSTYRGGYAEWRRSAA